MGFRMSGLIEDWRDLLDEWHRHLDEVPLGLGEELDEAQAKIAHLRPAYGRCPDGIYCQHGCPDGRPDYWGKEQAEA
jgi:hypothetical protein